MRCRPSLIVSSVVTVASFSLLAAGCGGGGSPRVASVASSTTTATTTDQHGLVGYANCMRSHGVPTFPDPDSSGGIPKPPVVAARISNPIKFNSAETACHNSFPNVVSLAPPETPQQLATRLADLLSFSRCMRSHGVSRFPDPNPQGQITQAMGQAAGIDLRSPAVLRATQACLPASHGEITPAKAAKALNNTQDNTQG